MKENSTTNNSSLYKKRLLIQSIVLNILAVILIVVGTVFVIFYAKGYRFNLYNSTIERTGVLNVESNPTRADFFLNDDVKGKSPKTISSIKEGDYEIQVWKEGYHTFKYKISIKIEKSTPVFAFLFRESPISRLIQAFETDIVSVVENSKRTELFMLEKVTEEDNVKTYRITSFKGNNNFWESNNTTQEVLTFTIGKDQTISSLNVSPDSKYVLLDILGTPEKEQSTALIQGKHLISTELNKVIKVFNIPDTNLMWANDGQTILYTQENKIYEIDINLNFEPVLIYSAEITNQIITMNTDIQGNIYTIEEKIESPEKFVILNQISQPNRIITLIDKIYYQTDDKYISEYKELNPIIYAEFSNAPQSTLLVGKPSSLLLSPETQSIFFTTEHASYRYNTETGKYALIIPFQTELLSISPDKKKILVLDKENQKIAVSIFDKESSSHFIILGTRTITDYPTATCTDIDWVNDSTELVYICENTLSVVDTDGLNNIPLISVTGEKFLIDSGSKNIYTLIPLEKITKKIETKTIAEKQLQTYQDLQKNTDGKKQILVEFEIH